MEVFGIPCRTLSLTSESSKKTLQQYAVGWCPGEVLSCRPKTDHVAVMFFKDDIYFWFHLRNEEFEIIFKEQL